MLIGFSGKYAIKFALAMWNKKIIWIIIWIIIQPNTKNNKIAVKKWRQN